MYVFVIPVKVIKPKERKKVDIFFTAIFQFSVEIKFLKNIQNLNHIIGLFKHWPVKSNNAQQKKNIYIYIYFLLKTYLKNNNKKKKGAIRKHITREG